MPSSDLKFPNKYFFLMLVEYLFAFKNSPTREGMAVCRFGGLQKKHPHRRGEDLAMRVSCQPYPETPPQSVGKTLSNHSSLSSQSKHPHRRGEDALNGVHLFKYRETPPQAWGRPRQKEKAEASDRNTLTDVGKTRIYLCRYPHYSEATFHNIIKKSVSDQMSRQLIAFKDFR